MCLAVPGKVVGWLDRDQLFSRAEIEFEGVRRVCHMACVPEVEVGEFVIVHAGVAISRVDAAEAQHILDELHHMSDSSEELPP